MASGLLTRLRLRAGDYAVVACLLILALGCASSREAIAQDPGEPSRGHLWGLEGRAGPGIEGIPTQSPGNTTPGRGPNALSALLPDLRTTTPAELYIEYAGDGARLLRFSTAVQNIGEGPLELVGEMQPDATIRATQIIEQTKGADIEREAGRLVMSDEHRHWHLENFAEFELFAASDGGAEPGDTLEGPAVTGKKITFCLIDEVRIDPRRQQTGGPEFVECDWEHQGISAGWMETYVASLRGQSLDITELPDGRYALRTTLDPDGLLREGDEDNNDLTVVIEITGDEVELIEERRTRPP